MEEEVVQRDGNLLLEEMAARRDGNELEEVVLLESRRRRLVLIWRRWVSARDRERDKTAIQRGEQITERESTNEPSCSLEIS